MQNDLTFCVGPAGTGKTYLAVAAAAHMLKHGHARRIVLARPAVEAGERLGLPARRSASQGQSVPYGRCSTRCNDMMDFEQVRRFMTQDIIEVIPLAFMRGRTLNESVIILDEAQNTTPSQMLMFLTRLGHDSKMIVTGDTTPGRFARGAAQRTGRRAGEVEGDQGDRNRRARTRRHRSAPPGAEHRQRVRATVSLVATDASPWE